MAQPAHLVFTFHRSLKELWCFDHLVQLGHLADLLEHGHSDQLGHLVYFVKLRHLGHLIRLG